MLLAGACIDRCLVVVIIHVPSQLILVSEEVRHKHRPPVSSLLDISSLV